MAGMMIAMAFSSCSTGDSGTSVKQLTPAEKSSCYMLTAGSRMNKLVYYSDEHVTESTVNGVKQKEYTDTMNVTTSIYGESKDTVFTVHNFPVKILARYIAEEASTKDLKEALKKYEGTTSLSCTVSYYSANPVYFFLYPKSTITCNLEYGGAAHKVDFYITAPSYYTYGTYDSNSKKVSAYLLMYGYKVDAKDKDTSNPTQFNFTMAGQNLTGTQLAFIE